MLAARPAALVIHGNYLDDEEIAFLAGHAERMAVVYCPRTHAWFGHVPYPLEKLLAAGVPVALGTDSRASSPDLSMLAEMRHVARRHPARSAARIVLRIGHHGRAPGPGLRAKSAAWSRASGPIWPSWPCPTATPPIPHELLFDR